MLLYYKLEVRWLEMNINWVQIRGSDIGIYLFLFLCTKQF